MKSCADVASRRGHELRQAPGPSTDRAPGALQPASQSTAAFFLVLLSDEQAATCLGVSVRKFHYLRAESWMPRPVVLGPRLLRWPRAELEQAVAAMPRQQAAAAEPRELARSRIERMKQPGVPA